MTEETIQNEFGRVDADGTVYVKDGDTERAVGQFSDGSPAEAMAFYTRRFEDLMGQVTLAEARISQGTAGVQVVQTVAKLAEQVKEPAAVGNLAALRDRVAALETRAAEFAAAQKAQKEAAKAQAAAEREAIVVAAEELAAQPHDKIRWKDTGKAFEDLFAQWQHHQRTTVQLPKTQADALWKRFRNARQSFEQARRRYFAQIDATNKEVKAGKERIIARAEELAAQGAAAIPSYRQLLDEWKAMPRANRKIEDSLWERFKAAGDVLYSARAAEMAVVDGEQSENLVRKQELLGEGEALLQLTDHKAARQQLTALQLRWDEIGRVPKQNVREVESRMRKLEDHVKQLEEDYWKATDPEPEARSAGLRGQLETSIAEIQAELQEATGARKTALEEKLKTQQEWLAALS